MARLEVELDPSGARAGARQIKRDLRDIIKDADRATDSMGKFGTKSATAMKKAGGEVRKFTTDILKSKLGVIALGVALGVAISKGFTGAVGLDRALAEASTLLEGTTEEMALMRAEAIRMSKTFGGSATQQVQAYYQAISAGMGSVEDATKFLDVANKLAVGGVTDVTTATDILSGALNVYGKEGLTAAAASDILFASVKGGKTTVRELGSSLGETLAIAQKLGIGFDQIAGAVSAVTTQSITTSKAVVGVKAALSNIAKPSQQALDLAEDLDLAFNAEALAAGTLREFLIKVDKATGGSADKMFTLFGSVEAVAAVMALTGQGAAKYAEIQDSVTNSTGVATTAFEKMADALSQRLRTSLTDVGEAFQAVGTVLLMAVVPAFEFLIRNIDIFAVVLGTLAISATIGKVIALGVAVKGLGVGFTLAYYSVTLFNSAIAFFGGPIGMAIAAAAALAGGLYYLATRHSEAAVAAREHAEWEAKTTDVINSAKASLRSYVSATKIDTAAIIEQYGEMANQVIASLRKIESFELEQAIKKTMAGVTQSFSAIDGITDGFAAEITDLERRITNLGNMQFFGNLGVSGLEAELATLKEIQGVLDGNLVRVSAAAAELDGLSVPISVFRDFDRLRTAFENAIQAGQWDDAFVAVGHLTALLEYIPEGPLRDAILQTGLLTQNLADAAIAAGQVEASVEASAKASAKASELSDRLEASFNRTAKAAALIAANLARAPSVLAGLETQAKSLGAQIDSLKGGNNELTAAAAGYRVELEKQYGLGDAISIAQAIAINKVVDGLVAESLAVGTLSEELNNLLNPDVGGSSAINKERVAYDTLRSSLDSAFAAQLEYTSGKMVLNKALLAEVINEEAVAATLDLLKNKYELATSAALQMKEQVADAVANSIGRSLTDMVEGTKTVKEAFKSMARDIIKELFQILVVQQLVSGIKMMFGFADGAAFSGGDVLANARGNAFSRGNVTAFASGGVVSSPTLFPMANGMGLMGEAGPEAIMPLSRGSDGKLGVKVNGDSGGQSSGIGDIQIINVLDPSIVGEYMDTAEGRRKIMNIIGEEQAA